MPKALKIVAALIIAAASAAIGWFGVKWYQASQPQASPTPRVTPTATATPVASVHLTFNLEQLSDDVRGLIPHPECGQEWSGEATDANGVTLTVDADLTNVDGADHLRLSSSYVTSGDDPVAFLGTEGDYIVTRDGKVVSPDWSAEYVPQYYVAVPGSATAAGDPVTLTGPTLCDVSDELSQIWAGVDFANATPEDIAQAQAKTDQFNEENALLPPGEYTIYAVAPIVVGEPAAIARALNEEGITDLGTLSYSIGDSELGDDPRLDPYCSDETNDAGNVVIRNCDVPQDVLSEVLARDVPRAYIRDGEPALAISEPVTITVP